MAFRASYDRPSDPFPSDSCGVTLTAPREIDTTKHGSYGPNIPKLHYDDPATYVSCIMGRQLVFACLAPPTSSGRVYSTWMYTECAAAPHRRAPGGAGGTSAVFISELLKSPEDPWPT